MVQDPQWMALLEANPKFQKLYDYAKSIKGSSPYFCANARWLFGLNQPSLKRYVELLSEGDPKTFKLTSQVIYSALPDCKKCYCKVVGIPPKNSKRIYIKQLFEKLAEISHWCNKNPDIAEEVYQSAQIIIAELEKLGIDKTISESILYIGGIIDDEFIDQFKEVYERRKV